MPEQTLDDGLFQRIVEQSPDALIFADAEGVIRVWNNASAKLFGYSPDEAVGRSLDLIIPEHLRAGHWKGFREALGSGTEKYRGQPLRTRAKDRVGNKVYVNFAFSLVKDSAGQVLGAVATARPASALLEAQH